MTTRTDPPDCNGVPPDDLVDPFVRRLNVPRGTWERAIVEHVPLDPTIGYIAMVVATHTDFTTGTNAFPGEKRLSEATGRSVRTVRNALAWLDEHGFLQRDAIGGRNPYTRYADVYSLSLPAPLAAKLGLWDEAGEDGDCWVERHHIGLSPTKDRPRPPERARLSQAGQRR